MGLDATLLSDAVAARDRVMRLQHEAELAQVGYQHAIRRLHASGASLRTIADELGVSYQRVHQIVDVGTGKGAVKATKKQGTCSFCGADSDAARGLVVGPGVSICDACADLAAEVLDDDAEKANERTRMVAVRAEHKNARCSFCGKPRDQVDAQAEAPDRPPAGKFGRRSGPVRICQHCVTLCGEILDQDRAG